MQDTEDTDLPEIHPEDDDKISLEVQKITEHLTSRKDIVRATATLLFFEYDIYPSARVVKKYIKKGNVNQINNDLRAFWLDVRTRYRDTFKAPLPPSLVNLVDTGLRQLWEFCQSQAKLNYEREHAAQAVIAQADILQKAQAEMIEMERKLEEAKATIAQKDELIKKLLAKTQENS